MLDRNQARFLIAARTFLSHEKMKNPAVNIYDCEVPGEEVAALAGMDREAAEATAKSLQEAGLIHMFVCGGGFGSCKVASLAFDKLDEYLLDYRRRT